MFECVKKLGFDMYDVVYSTDGGVEISIFRPSEPSKRFEHYDKNKNFQIWLKEGNRDFKPNHLRVLIDLNLRIRSRPDLKKQLLLAFDKIFYGEDPELVLKSLEKEHFEHSLNDLIVIGILAQLLLIEQEYCYYGESQFDPPNLFLQGWIREFIDNPKEIDNLCMAVCSRQAPLARYVDLENKKSKKHVKSLSELWYLESN